MFLIFLDVLVSLLCLFFLSEKGSELVEQADSRGSGLSVNIVMVLTKQRVGLAECFQN